MRLHLQILLGVTLLSCAITAAAVHYDPTWESLDTRPLPTWFDESKLGIFIHWGVFSQIGYHSEWVWWAWKGSKDADVVQYFRDNFPPDVTYADFAQQFGASFFDPNQWADLFAASGAKYVVLTSKHHEGFTLWPSSYSFNWNAMDVGPHRDLVGDLANAVRNRTDLHFGLYHSMFEWFHPLYLQDKANNWKTQDFPFSKTLPELHEIVNAYKPDVIWSDGDWEAPDVYWNSTGFAAWLYNESPVKDSVVTNDRWGAGIPCHHGGYYTCTDKYNPGTLQPKKWENCMTLDDQSWGYRRNINNVDVLSITDLIATFAATVSCGGNFLLNIGPTGDGTIPAIFQERLTQLGQWMEVNGEAIYKSVPWSKQNDTLTKDVWYTSKKGADGVDVYAIILNWSANATIVLGAPKVSANTVINILGYPVALKYRTLDQGIEIALPPLQDIPAPQAWGVVMKLTQLSNKHRPKRIMALPERYRRNSKIRTY
ncbi:Alpha-L-fucosidase [Hypsibius exemplaris]|uniref:Putative alpha-L-fucosidase n=1 Tax=Hypsibius exemplaris TaxID=2072580 RepID=A0A1W0WQ65_HYPEX|nr:Alpha-L-fucosidase [Hypsibius exemplaris]